MTTELTMPQMGYDMQEGTILKWLKSEGDAVENGDPIAEIETDKAVVEFESYAAGVLSSILVSAGSTVPVGEPIAVIGAEADAAAPPPPIADAPDDADAAQSDDDADDASPAADASDDAPDADALDAAAPAPTAADAPDAPATAIPMPAAGESLTAQEPPPAPAAVPLRASPVARRIADEQGVDIAQVQGSGPGGRVTRDDVLAFAAASEQTSEEQPAADLAAAQAQTELAAARMAADLAAAQAEEPELADQEQAADEAPADADDAPPIDEADSEIGIWDTEAPPEDDADAVPDAELDGEPESAEAPPEPPAADAEPVDAAETDAQPEIAAETDSEPAAADEPVALDEPEPAAADPVAIEEPAADPVAIEEPAAEPAATDEPEPVADAEPAADDEPADPAVLPLTRMRRQIARVTVRSKSEKPHFYITSEVDMTDAMALRGRINAALADEGTRVTVNDMIIKACVDALQKHPKFNAFLDGDAIRLNDSVNVGVAMAVEDGLLMPAIMGCEGMSLKRLALASKDLADRAQNGALRPDEYTGGTFGVSNLGMFDVSTFVAIIQPPQSAILAVGTVAEKPVVRGGEIVVRQTMNATISADHRVVDGAEGARFLIEVKRSLENPLSLLL